VLHQECAPGARSLDRDAVCAAYGDTAEESAYARGNGHDGTRLLAGRANRRLNCRGVVGDAIALGPGADHRCARRRHCGHRMTPGRAARGSGFLCRPGSVNMRSARRADVSRGMRRRIGDGDRGRCHPGVRQKSDGSDSDNDGHARQGEIHAPTVAPNTPPRSDDQQPECDRSAILVTSVTTMDTPVSLEGQASAPLKVLRDSPCMLDLSAAMGERIACEDKSAPEASYTS